MATPDIQNLFERFLQIYGGQGASTEPTRSEPRYQSSQPAYSAPADAYTSDDGYAPTGGLLRGWSSPSPAAPWWIRAPSGSGGMPVGLRGPRLGGRLGGLPFFPMPPGQDDVVEIPNPHLERGVPRSTHDFWNAMALVPQMLRGQLLGEEPWNGNSEGENGPSSTGSPPEPPANRPGSQPPWIVGPAILKEEIERQGRTGNRDSRPKEIVDPNFRRLTRVPPVELGSEGGNVVDSGTAQSGANDDGKPAFAIASPPLAPGQERSSWRDTLDEMLREMEAANGGSNGRGAPPSRKDDYCSDRWEAEKGKCWSTWRERRDGGLVGYPWDDILEGCKERARQRYMACFQNGGRPPKRELSEWGPGDEEAWFNEQR